MSEMRDSQQKILNQIKRLGPQTVKQLADQLGITSMAIRQHLAQLERDELVESLPEETQARGRPVKPWQLTSKGHNRFPDAHADVTVELIASVRDVLGEAALDQVIAARTATTLQQYQNELDQYDSLADKMNALTALRTAEGYMAELLEDADGYTLLENHCPICSAATACQGFCRSELEVFQTVLSPIASVKREDHLLTGARRCSYRIVPQTR